MSINYSMDSLKIKLYSAKKIKCSGGIMSLLNQVTISVFLFSFATVSAVAAVDYDAKYMADCDILEEKILENSATKVLDIEVHGLARNEDGSAIRVKGEPTLACCTANSISAETCDSMSEEEVMNLPVRVANAKDLAKVLTALSPRASVHFDREGSELANKTPRNYRVVNYADTKLGLNTLYIRQEGKAINNFCVILSSSIAHTRQGTAPIAIYQGVMTNHGSSISMNTTGAALCVSDKQR
jgi:hypothetical protein